MSYFKPVPTSLSKDFKRLQNRVHSGILTPLEHIAPLVLALAFLPSEVAHLLPHHGEKEAENPHVRERCMREIRHQEREVGLEPTVGITYRPPQIS